MNDFKTFLVIAMLAIACLGVHAQGAPDWIDVSLEHDIDLGDNTGDAQDDRVAVFRAQTKIPDGGTLYFPAGIYDIKGTLYLGDATFHQAPGSVKKYTLKMEQGAVLRVHDGGTLYVYASVDAGFYPIFDWADPGANIHLWPLMTNRLPVSWFGAVGDGLANDTKAIQDALASLIAGYLPTLYFPKPFANYLTDETVTVPANVAVLMDGPLNYQGPKTEPALVIGEAGQSSTADYVLDVVQNGFPDWSPAPDGGGEPLGDHGIGINLVNFKYSRVRIKQVKGFRIGARCIGDGRAFSYNHFELGLLINNQIGLKLTQASNGWVNENLFLNGEFLAGTQESPLGRGRYGVVVSSEDSATTASNLPNNNVFIKPSFELGEYRTPCPTTIQCPSCDNGCADTEEVREAVPVVIEYGGANSFLNCRAESYGPAFARILNNSVANEFTVAIADDPLVIEDIGEFGTSLAKRQLSAIRDQKGFPVFDSGFLVEKATPYDATRIHVANVDQACRFDCGALTPKAPYTALDGLVVGSDHLEIPYNRALGVAVDTAANKRFVLRRETLDGFPGRVGLVCYDAAGIALDEGAVPLANRMRRHFQYIPRDESSGIPVGEYVTTTSEAGDLFFRVQDEVKSVFLYLAGDRVANVPNPTLPEHFDLLPAKVRRFVLEAVDVPARVSTSYGSPQAGARLAVEAPASGAAAVGEMVYNHEPAAGEPIGWICTQAGNPGTWLPFGFISPNP